MQGSDELKSSKWKILRKNKKSQIWTKKALFEYFRLKFEKANVIFEINAFEFIQIPRIEQNNNDNSNNNKWDQKFLIWVFWPVDLKNGCYIWNQHPQICQNAKFTAKIKIQNKTKKVILMQIWKSVNRLYMEIICWKSHIKTLCTFWDIVLILNVSKQTFHISHMWKVCLQTFRVNTIC